MSLEDQRIQRLLRSGAVDLGQLKEDRGLAASVRIGTYETGIKFRFRCQLCGRIEVNDQEMEPMCTGPSWTDDHEPFIMRLIDS